MIRTRSPVAKIDSSPLAVTRPSAAVRSANVLSAMALFRLGRMGVNHARGIDEGRPGIDGGGRPERLGDLFLRGTGLDRRSGEHGDAAVAAVRYRDRKGDQLVNLGTEQPGLSGGTAEHLIALDGVRTDAGDVAHAGEYLLVVGVPIHHRHGCTLRSVRLGSCRG